MVRYVLRRLLFSIPVLILASVIVFVGAREATSPLAAVRSNPRLSVEDIRAYKETLGLDKSGTEQYLAWLGNFARGDWGKSLISNRPVAPDLRRAFANTAVLGMTAFALSVLIGVAIGVLSAVRQYSIFDHVSTGAAFLGVSIPTFWFGLIAQLVFGLYLLQWFDLSEPIFFTAGMTRPGSSGFDVLDRLRHLALPVLVLSVQLVALYSRYMRSSMLEVLNCDYMRTARAKGLSAIRVLVHHGLRNALIPLTTLAAIDLGGLAAGLIVTETVFQWPGMGTFFLDAMQSGDYAQVLPWAMVVVASVVCFNLVADLALFLLDPRIRHA